MARNHLLFSFSFNFFFPEVSFCIDHFYESTLHLPHEQHMNLALEQQKGGRDREKWDRISFTPDFYKLPWDYAPRPQWWSWGQKIVWIPVYYLAEIVCHLVVCWSPTNINLKNSKALEDITTKKKVRITSVPQRARAYTNTSERCICTLYFASRKVFTIRMNVSWRQATKTCIQPRWDSETC